MMLIAFIIALVKTMYLLQLEFSCFFLFVMIKKHFPMKVTTTHRKAVMFHFKSIDRNKLVETASLTSNGVERNLVAVAESIWELSDAGIELTEYCLAQITCRMEGGDNDVVNWYV